MTIIMVPWGLMNAGNINSMLLPPPMGITATMGLCWRTMAWMMAFYGPRNAAMGPIICCNDASTSMAYVRCHRTF